MDIHDARKLAEELAKANVQVEPNISEVYWVPKEDRVYLVEVDETSIPSDEYLRPIYFAPESDVPLPSGIAMVTKEEFGKLSLPSEWGAWDELELIWAAEKERAGGL